MRRFWKLVIAAGLLIVLATTPAFAAGYTLDTEHPLYANMKGIYVFDNRADDGDNIAGTGTMVGTVEDADGFDTPISQSFQAWYNSFGAGYTICIWHDGMTLGAWGGIFTIWSAGDGAALCWQRNNLVDEVRVYHNATGTGMAGLNMADIADPQMLALRWDEAYCSAWDDGVWIAHIEHGTDPKTNCSDAAIGIGGQCTVTRVYIFDTDISNDAIAALAADPDSIFDEEEPPPGNTYYYRRNQ